MPIVGAIVQARVGSRRLPGKTLKPILGRPLITYVMDQVRAARQLDKVILATTTSAEDDPLVDLCVTEGWEVFRGSESDVLDRFHQAAVEHDLDAVVRITGDCPLKDPKIVDWVVSSFRRRAAIDYAATHLEPRLPAGMDVDMFGASALQYAWNHAELPSEREHVNPFFRKHPELFRHLSLVYPRDLTRYRLAVDEPEDFLVVQRIIESLYTPGKTFKLNAIVDYLEAHPEVGEINARLVRDEGYIESLKADLGALDISLPADVERREWQQYVARRISEWMGKLVESAQVAPRECTSAETAAFDVILRGEILDTVEVDEVRVPLCVRVATAGPPAQAHEPVRNS